MVCTIFYKEYFIFYIDAVQKNESKTKRLRNNLRELEDLFMATSSNNADGNLSVIWSAWRSSILLQIMFSNGLIASLVLDKLGNLERIVFDKVNYATKCNGGNEIQISLDIIIYASKRNIETCYEVH